jgi:S-formylglutathione hydrolase FrmB
MVVVPPGYFREPDDARNTRRYPVAYLLHGFAASYLRYHEKLTEAGKSLTDLAERFNTILVMPDGGGCSWYLDAPTDQPGGLDWQYETIITKHMIPEIDRRYRTWPERTGRGITGISMGGHGALYLSARHPDLFLAASSMSGIMDLRETTSPSALAARIGSLEQHRQRWMEYSVLAHAERFVGHDTALLLDVGWDDPFISSNRALHDKFMRLNVPHDYIERPGRHEWKYWINALPYHLQFLTDRLKPAGTR